MCIKKLSIILVLIFMLDLSLLFSQENDKETMKKLTLDSCINVALNNNPDIRMIAEDENIVKNNYKIAQAEYRPTVGMGYSLSPIGVKSADEIGETRRREIDEGERIPVPFQDTTTRSAFSLGISYTIWKPGRDNRLTIARISVENGRLNNVNTFNSVVYGVKKAYYDYLRKHRAVELKKSALEKYSLIYRRLQIESMAGHVGPVELSRWEIERSSAQLDYDEAVFNFSKARSALFLAMGIKDTDQNIELDNEFNLHSLTLTIEKLNQLALVNSPRMIAVRKNSDIQKQYFEIAKKQREPTVSVSVTGTAYNDSASYINDYFTKEKKDSDGVHTDVLGENWKQGFTYSLSASMPIYTGGKIPASIDEKKSQFSKARYKEQKELINIMSSVEDHYNTLSFIKKQMNISKARILNTQTNLRIVERSFENGLSDQDDLLSATESVYNAEIGLLNNKISYMLNLTSLANLIGVDEEFLCQK